MTTSDYFTSFLRPVARSFGAFGECARNCVCVYVRDSDFPLFVYVLPHEVCMPWYWCDCIMTLVDVLDSSLLQAKKCISFRTIANRR